MPTYNYICEDCGHEFEQFQFITARLLRKCPSCGEKQLKRLIGSGSGIIFKGSGFYQTDYRSKNYKDAQKKEKTEKKDTKTESKETKPETKANTTPKNKKESV